MLELLVFLPLLAGAMAWFLPFYLGRGLLLLTAGGHLVLAVLAWTEQLVPRYPQFFALSPEGLLVLAVISFVFFCSSCYGVAYMHETEMQSEHIFSSCMLLFLGTMSMVALTDHPIVLWIAIEATTLVSAPLLFINRSKEALEATWKYVLICSVGIALALLGCFFITLSMELHNIQAPLHFSSLRTVAAQLDPLWLKAGFLFVVIGYGTKMGLAPMHTWLPDAYSQAPSPAAALLSGALESCAYLGIYKVLLLMHSAGLGAYASDILIGFGLFSMLLAGIFILHQTDYKRLLAYSSVEHMGIIAFGTGIGGLAAYGAILHLIHHSLLKSSLFLSAGNILLGFGSRLVKRTGNLAGLFPQTFVAFFSGFAGISGFPPFGLFVSELLIIMGAFQQHAYVSLTIFLFCLMLVFAGAASLFMRISFARTSEEILVAETYSRAVPPYILLLASIILCIWIPDRLHQAILSTISLIGGGLHG